MCVGMAIEGDAPRDAECRPVYPISVAADILGVHQRTLRIYESEGLLLPARRGRWRFYSQRDLCWARSIRYLIHEKGVNVAGLRRMVSLIRCWEIKGCTQEIRESCPKFMVNSRPCWLVATDSLRKCCLCPVYQHVSRHICDKEELKEGEKYGE